MQNKCCRNCKVLREGGVGEIDAQEVVPGDVVWLEAGFRVAMEIHKWSWGRRYGSR